VIPYGIVTPCSSEMGFPRSTIDSFNFFNLLVIVIIIITRTAETAQSSAEMFYFRIVTRIDTKI